MKSIILIVLLVCLGLLNPSFGQDSTQNSLKRGKFALQFQLDGNFTLKPFQETSFSGKYLITDLSAIRAGIQFSNSVDVESKIDDKDTTKQSSLNIKINAQYIYYLSVVDDICLYTGSGLSYGRDLYTNGSYYEEQDSWSIGLSGIIGMEWFVKKNISLSGEYSLVLNYYDNYYKGPDRNQIIERHIKKVSLSSYNQFKIGVSLYL